MWSKLYILYYLNRICSFYFRCVSIKSFYNEAFVVWLLLYCLKQDAPQSIIFILQTHLFRDVQRNRLKAWIFITKNKVYQRCFDNNFKKLFQTKMLKSSTEQILLIAVLMVVLRLKLQKETVN